MSVIFLVVEITRRHSSTTNVKLDDHRWLIRLVKLLIPTPALFYHVRVGIQTAFLTFVNRVQVEVFCYGLGVMDLG